MSGVPPSTRKPAVVLVLAWGLCALYVLLWLALVSLYVAGVTRSFPALSTLVCGYALVGALIAFREPRNTVGWLMLIIASLATTKDLADVYVSDLDRPLESPLGWVASVLPTSAIYLAVLALLLVFPDRLVPSRWRPVVWFGVVGLGCPLVGAAFGAALVDVATPVTLANPLAATANAPADVSAFAVLGELLLSAGLALGIASLVVRLRRSRGRRRQQVAWFAYVGAMALSALLLARFAAAAPGEVWAPVVSDVGWYIALFFIAIGIPVTIGMAILRHRLYDIDLVIRRTLVYGSLTFALGGVYTLLVVSLPVLIAPLAGTRDLAVAASTLVVAALFRPARDRIQQVVDRRFYRRKYDTVRTVESFTARLRDEVDLDALSRDLREVVRDTLNPVHVSLWLRGVARPGS